MACLTKILRLGRKSAGQSTTIDRGFPVCCTFARTGAFSLISILALSIVLMFVVGASAADKPDEAQPADAVKQANTAQEAPAADDAVEATVSEPAAEEKLAAVEQIDAIKEEPAVEAPVSEPTPQEPAPDMIQPEPTDEELPADDQPAADAENPGLADLNQAIEVNLSVSSLADVAEVIRLGDSALRKGLDEGNRTFAEALLASALIRRGTMVSTAIINKAPLDSRWPQFRHVALADLERGVKLAPNQPEALLLISRLNLLPKGDLKRARQTNDQAIVLLVDQPRKRAKALVMRAEMQKDNKKKMADLSQAIELAPDDATLLRVRGLVSAREKDYQAALKDFEKALELEPDDASTHQARGLMLAHLERWKESIAALDKASELVPQSAAPWIQKSRVYAEKEDYPSALKALDEAHDLEPASLDVLLLRAGIYETMGNWDKALENIDEVLAMRPSLPNGRRMRAAILFESGQLDQAVAEIEKLLKDNPNDTAAKLQQAAYQTAQGNNDQALVLYGEILTENPKHWRALRGRADFHLNHGRHAEAIADYKKILPLNPNDPSTLNNLAWVLATSPEESLRDGERAVELATKASEETDYQRSYILSTLAAAYAEKGDFPSAIKWAEKAVEKADSDEIKQAVEKELVSYREGKPWREMLEESAKPLKKKPAVKALQPPLESPVEDSDKPMGQPPTLPPVEPPPIETPTSPPAKPLAAPSTK